MEVEQGRVWTGAGNRTRGGGGVRPGNREEENGTRTGKKSGAG